MSRRLKSVILFALKVIVAAVLIGLLVRSNALDFSKMRVFVDSPVLLVGDVVVWILCAVVFTVIRWRLLLRLADARVPLGRAIMLQLTAVFFNVVIPGNVGGDVVKALYVARDEAPAKRPTILLVAFMERFLGLAGLVAMCGVVTLVRLPSLWSDPVFRPMVLTVAALAAATLLGPALGVLAVRKWGDRLERMFEGGTTIIPRLARQLIASARLVANGPVILGAALLLSMVNHMTGITLFIALTHAITGQDVSYGQMATVYPTGILSLVLPIAPAGMGVGHLAFDRLFAAIGLTGGATVFNVFLLGQVTPNLLGVFPYLMLRRSLPTEGEPKA